MSPHFKNPSLSIEAAQIRQAAHYLIDTVWLSKDWK